MGDAEADPEEAFWYSLTAQMCGISVAHGTDETVCAVTYFFAALSVDIVVFGKRVR